MEIADSIYRAWAFDDFCPKHFRVSPPGRRPEGTSTNLRGSSPDIQLSHRAGDVLQINVWKEAEVSTPSVVVRPDGIIVVPLIKEVAAAGLTTEELERVLVDKLAMFLKDQNGTIVVKEVHSKKVYLVGAVQKTGP